MLNKYLFVVLSLSFLTIIQALSLRPKRVYYNTNNMYKMYPKKLISVDNFTDFYVIDVPYCKTNYCKFIKVGDDKIKLISLKNFILEKYFSLIDVDLNKSKVRNSYNGMTLFIPKTGKDSDIESKDNTNNIDNEVYISDGIYVEDIEGIEEFPKNKDAISGFLDNRNRWINY